MKRCDVCGQAVESGVVVCGACRELTVRLPETEEELESLHRAVMKACGDCDVQQVAATLQVLKERKENGKW